MGPGLLPDRGVQHDRAIPGTGGMRFRPVVLLPRTHGLIRVVMGEAFDCATAICLKPENLASKGLIAYSLRRARGQRVGIGRHQDPAGMRARQCH